MRFKKDRGYIETSSLFGWIVLIAVLGTAIYFGKNAYDSYSAGYDKGLKDGHVYADGPSGHVHGKVWDDTLTKYLDEKHTAMKVKTYRDRAYAYGWEEGFHYVLDRILH